MPSQLSRQLEHLGLSKGFSGSGAGKASLVYSRKDAANVTAEDIYRGCLEGGWPARETIFGIRTIFRLLVSASGYAELCGLDSRFLRFQSALFSGVPKEREQNTKEENEAMNADLQNFLRLLTDHFLETSCFKVLEHLIRSFK